MKLTEKMSESKKTLLRDTLHMSIGQGGKLVIQAAYFVLIARSLGPSYYGAFVAITALTGIVAPFCGLGTPNLFVKNFRSGTRTAAVCWGNGLLITITSGLCLSFAITALNVVLKLKATLLVIFVVAMCDLVFMKVADLAAWGFAATGSMKDTAIQGFIMSALRLIAIAFLAWHYHLVTFNQWIVAYAVTGVLGTIYALYTAWQMWGKPEWDGAAAKADIKEGIYFSISTSAQSIYNDIDKTMLGRISSLADTGIYGAAYRFIDVSMTPVRSLVSAAYPRFFKVGTDGGLVATRAYALKLISKSVLYGLAIFLGLVLAAPAIPFILGHRYDAVVPAVRWLAIIPLLRCVHSLLADALTGAGYQRERTGIQIMVAIVNVLLNLWILPRWSWRGAAWTSIASDALLLLTVWAFMEWKMPKDTLQRENAQARV
jgi:O-antigen/teichoic acid export membrane protein